MQKICWLNLITINSDCPLTDKNLQKSTLNPEEESNSEVGLTFSQSKTLMKEKQGKKIT
jgi:hypothetical protein